MCFSLVSTAAQRSNKTSADVSPWSNAVRNVFGVIAHCSLLKDTVHHIEVTETWVLNFLK